MTLDSGFLAEEQQEAEEIKKEQRRQTEQFLSDVRKTFGTAHGKRIFTFLLEQGGVNAPLFQRIPTYTAMWLFMILWWKMYWPR